MESAKQKGKTRRCESVAVLFLDYSFFLPFGLGPWESFWVVALASLSALVPYATRVPLRQCIYDSPHVTFSFLSSAHCFVNDVFT